MQMNAAVMTEIKQLNRTADELDALAREAPDTPLTIADVAPHLSSLNRRLAGIVQVMAGCVDIDSKLVDTAKGHTKILESVVRQQASMGAELEAIDDGESWKRGRPEDDSEG